MKANFLKLNLEINLNYHPHQIKGKLHDLDNYLLVVPCVYEINYYNHKKLIGQVFSKKHVYINFSTVSLPSREFVSKIYRGANLV